MFDPASLLKLSKEKLQERWEILLKCFISLGDMSLQRCDQATSQYKRFINDQLKEYQAELNDYSQNDRLDKFYFDVIGIKKYEEVSFVLKSLLTLSSGQVTVERGFSNNNN